MINKTDHSTNKKYIANNIKRIKNIIKNLLNDDYEERRTRRIPAPSIQEFFQMWKTWSQQDTASPKSHDHQ